MDRYFIGGWEDGKLPPVAPLSEEALAWSKTYNANGLLEKYQLNDYGTWRVVAEDRDGAGYERLLGYYKGYLAEVINKAVLDDWFGHGRIEKIEVETIRRV